MNAWLILLYLVLSVVGLVLWSVLGLLWLSRMNDRRATACYNWNPTWWQSVLAGPLAWILLLKSWRSDRSAARR